MCQFGGMLSPQLLFSRASLEGGHTSAMAWGSWVCSCYTTGMPAAIPGSAMAPLAALTVTVTPSFSL